MRSGQGVATVHICFVTPYLTDRQTKWVFSDAVSCSDDMGRGDLHYRSIRIYGQV